MVLKWDEYIVFSSCSTKSMRSSGIMKTNGVPIVSTAKNTPSHSCQFFILTTFDHVMAWSASLCAHS